MRKIKGDVLGLRRNPYIRFLELLTIREVPILIRFAPNYKR